MAIEQCRIWWPRQQLQLVESGSVRLILFGWLFTKAGSLDIVVSAAVSQDQILQSFATRDILQAIVLSSNEKMPVSLQESATFIILGDYVLHLPGRLEEDLLFDAKFTHDEHFGASKDIAMSGSDGNRDQRPSYDHRKRECECSILDGFLDTYRKSTIKEGNWVHFFCNSEKSFQSNLNQVPVLGHLYLGGQLIGVNHCHVCHTI